MEAYLCPVCGEKTAVCYSSKTVDGDFRGYKIKYGLICTNCGYKKISRYNLKRNNHFCLFPKCPWCHKPLNVHIVVHNHQKERAVAHP